jgi:integrase
MKGYIRKRGDSKWQIEIDIGRSPDGKRMKKTETIQGTKKESQSRMADLIHQISHNTFIMPEKMMVRDFFDYWLENYVKQNLAISTIESYSMIIRKHLSPAIGHIELQKILPIHIQEYYGKALRSGLSAKTVHYHHRVMHKIFDNALKLQLISRNIIEAVEPPKPKKYRAAFLDVQEVSALRKAIEDTKFEVPVNLAVLLGLRWGEVFGLKWTDINFEKKLLTVTRELIPTKEGIIFKEGTKKCKLHRVINLPEVAYTNSEKT